MSRHKKSHYGYQRGNTDRTKGDCSDAEVTVCTPTLQHEERAHRHEERHDRNQLAPSAFLELRDDVDSGIRIPFQRILFSTSQRAAGRYRISLLGEFHSLRFIVDFEVMPVQQQGFQQWILTVGRNCLRFIGSAEPVRWLLELEPACRYNILRCWRPLQSAKWCVGGDF